MSGERRSMAISTTVASSTAIVAHVGLAGLTVVRSQKD